MKNENNTRSLAVMRREAREYNDSLMDTMLKCMDKLGLMHKDTSEELCDYYCNRIEAFIHIEDSVFY